jgi:hypothetical protein
MRGGRRRSDARGRRPDARGTATARCAGTAAAWCTGSSRSAGCHGRRGGQVASG